MFIDTSRVAVNEHGEIPHDQVTAGMDVMYIRKKMDFGTRQKVTSAAMRIETRGKQTEQSLDLAAWQLALAQHNILEWSGPSFVGIPCTPANIARLDPDHPLLAAALNAIGERNNAEGGLFVADPKSSTSAGATNGVASPHALDSTISP